MVKKILLSFFSCFVLLSFVKAGGLNQPLKPVLNNPMDTTGTKDSMQTAGLNKIREIKNDFKNLFIHPNPEEGIRIELLNPKAINFVEDYIKKHSRNLVDMKDWEIGRAHV